MLLIGSAASLRSNARVPFSVLHWGSLQIDANGDKRLAPCPLRRQAFSIYMFAAAVLAYLIGIRLKPLHVTINLACFSVHFPDNQNRPKYL
jgi:hypothetical protein